MVNIKIVSGAVGVVLSLILTVPPCIAADKQDSTRRSLPPPPKALEVLDVYIGSWAEKSVIQPNRLFPDGLTGTKQWSAKRILNDQFIEATGKTTYPAGVVESRLIYTFDATLGKYRMWRFDSGGSTSSWNGTYDPATQVITWEAVNLPYGRKSIVEERLSADKITYRARVWTGEGTVDFDSSDTATRVKDELPESPKNGNPAANP